MNLQRFLDAQQPVYELALEELKAGHKQSHWIWFIFPQLRGLGSSQRAQFYGIECLDEARAYQQHPVLGRRLHECTTAVLRHTEQSASQILGTPDDLKFFSSMTLFSEAAPQELVFRLALQAFFNGAKDPETLRLSGVAAGSTPAGPAAGWRTRSHADRPRSAAHPPGC